MKKSELSQVIDLWCGFANVEENEYIKWRKRHPELENNSLIPATAYLNYDISFQQEETELINYLKKLSDESISYLEMIFLVGREFYYSDEIEKAPFIYNLSAWREFLGICKTNQNETIDYLTSKSASFVLRCIQEYLQRTNISIQIPANYYMNGV